MSVLDGFLKAMKLDGEGGDFYDDENESADNRYYDDDEDDDIQNESVTPIRERSSMRQEAPMERIEERSRRNQGGSSQGNSNSIRSIQNNNRQRKGGNQGMEICSIKPTSMEDTREVTDTLLKNRPVILNLEGIDVEVAQRIVDFVSGSCYAIRGNLQKISRYIFIITPANVDVSGDFLEIVGGGFSGASAQGSN